ncbi:MAG: lamin tail domain-containing protein, partial [Elusimicrobiales bacterium]
YQTWIPPNWSAEADSSLGGSVIRWSVLRSVPLVADQKLAGLLKDDNTLSVLKWDGSAWSDVTPAPAPTPGGSATRRFDLAPESLSGRMLVAYYNGTLGAVTYAVWSSSASAWATTPASLPMTALGGSVNWVRLKSMPGTNRVLLAAMDANSDISAAVWNGSTWIDNVNLTAAASIATRETFDAAWETQTGDALMLWGEGTGTNYRKWYSATGWGGITAGPAIAATAGANWIRLCSDPVSNRIGFTSLDGDLDWNTAVWRPSGTEGWSALPTQDTAMSGSAYRMTDCAWESQSGELLAVAVDDSGATDNKFDWITWAAGAWSPASPSVTATNNNTVFAGSITWLSLIPDPNTDNITALAMDAANDVRSTVWNGTAWAAAGATTNVLHESNGSDHNYEFAAADFDRHDIVPPTVADNQAGDDNWRNASPFYNVDATDSGGSKLARIQTKLHTAAGLGGTQLQDWTDQVSGINLDSYTTDWTLATGTFALLPQGQSYISVRALDNVGNISNSIVDAFYVKKDTTVPTITSNLAAGYDGTWRSADPGAVFDVDFADTGGAQISSITWSAWSGAARTGLNAVDNAVVSSGTGVGNSYTADWAVNFDLLAHGTNYITVSVTDWASSSATLVDAFRVLKDTQAPAVITDLAASPGPLRGSVKLEWSAPGDDGTQNRNSQGGYIVRYATYNITPGFFDSAGAYAQTWLPLDAGLTESKVIYGLEAGKTYYFAVKAFDKAASTAAISNVPSSLPQTANVYINEVYPSGAAAADDWVELFNNTSSTFNLAGWTLVYDQGTIDLPGPETTVWTGAAVDRSSVSAHFVSSVTLNLNGALSYHLVLKDSSGVVIDRVQWPPLSSGQSFARIEDGNADFFEIDPTPTKGYANAITTDPVKLNEVSYGALSSEFAELFNTGTATPTLAGYALRSSNLVKFPFTRKIYAGSYALLDFSSLGDDLTAWQTAFGAAGLNPAGDYLALENPAGQTVDRVTWQSGVAYSLYNYKAALVSAAAYAPASAANSIGRQPSEGADTGADSTDFVSQAAATPMSRNNGAGSGAANTLTYPANNQILPRKFPLRLTLGADSAGGTADNIALTRTGGAADNYSPHVYRLGDIGFDLAALSAQSTAQTGVSFPDQDGRPLVHNAVYRLSFNSDSAAASAPRITLATVTYDSSAHTVSASTTAPTRVNQDAFDDLARFYVSNNSPSGYNAVELASAAARFYDANLVPLTTLQAQNLFDSIFVARDSTSGLAGVYEPAIDNSTAAYISNGQLSLDGSGRQFITVADPNLSAASVPAASTGTFYLAVRLKPDAASQTPKTFRLRFDAAAELTMRDGPSDFAQTLAAAAEIVTSSTTAIIPASAPPGTSWPYIPPSATTVETPVDYDWLGGASPTVYSPASDGVLRALNGDGTLKWEFQTSPLSPIRSAPTFSSEGANKYVYFADDNGDVYKVEDLGASVSQVWKRGLGSAVRSSLMIVGGKVFLGTAGGRVYCLNVSDGLDCAGWSFSAGIDAPIAGTMSIDDRTDINRGWIGLDNGKMVAFGTADGTVNTSFQTGAAIKGSPYVDAGYGGANNNLYITSTDGKLYSRVSANLASTPAQWTDCSAAAPINGSPWIAQYLPSANNKKYVFFGDDSGRLYKVYASTGANALGECDAIFQAGGAVKAIPVVVTSGTIAGVYNDYAYFGADDGLVYAVDVETGQHRDGWPVATGGPVRSAPVIDVDNKRLIIGSNDGKTYVLNIGP